MISRNVYLIGLFMLISSGLSEANEGAWTSIGPEGGSILSLAIDPQNSSIVYAGTEKNGVFKSTDGGLTWTITGSELIGVKVFDLEVDPQSTATIYAGCSYYDPGNGGNTGIDAGIFKSTDGGDHWTPMNSGIPPAKQYPVSDLAINAENSSTIFAVTHEGVFKSVNASASWDSLHADLEEVLSGYLSDPITVNIDPQDTSTVYVGIFEEGFFKTMDGGVSWDSINVGLTGRRLHALAINPLNPIVLYAGIEGGLFRSTDGGGNWTAIPVTPSTVYTIAIDPIDTARVYIGTNGEGIYQTTDSGATWSSITGGVYPHIRDIIIDPTNTSILYAATTGRGIFKTVDRGGTWTAQNAGLIATNVNAVAINPADSLVIYMALDGGGVLKTINGGNTWVPVDTGLPYSVQCLAIDQIHPDTVYAGAWAGGAFKTTDGGQSWSPINSGIFPAVTDLKIDPNNRFKIYAIVLGDVYGSSDAGLTWTPLATSTSAIAQSIVIDPLDSSKIYVSSMGEGVSKSSDGGINWSTVNTGVPANPNINTQGLAIDPLNPSTLYVGVWVVGVFKTGDEGINWAATGLHDPTPITPVNPTIAVNPSIPSIVYAGDEIDGVFRTLDGGASWTTVNNQLKNTLIRVVEIDPHNPSRIYAGTSGGLFVLMDPNALPPPSIALSRNRHSFGYIQQYQSATWELQIYNTGPGDGLRIDSIAPMGLGGGMFSVVSPPALPHYINAGDSLTVQLQYLPSALGTTQDTLIITSNDAANPTQKVVLSGAGIDSNLWATYQLSWTSAYRTPNIKSLAIGNTQGDTNPEIVTGDANGVIIVHDAITRAQVDSFAVSTFPGPAVKNLTLSDLTNDGLSEIIAAFNQEIHIYTHNGTNYVQIRASNPLNSGINGLAVEDVDQDGMIEIMAALNYPDSVYVLDNTTLQIEWQAKIGGNGLDTDAGAFSIHEVVTAGSGGVGNHDFGGPVRVYEGGGTHQLGFIGFGPGGAESASNVVVEQIAGDTQDDIIAGRSKRAGPGSDEGYIDIYQNPTMNWGIDPNTIDFARPTWNTEDLKSSVFGLGVGHIHDQGTKIVARTRDGSMHVFDSQTHDLEAQWSMRPFGAGIGPHDRAPLVAADIDLDGVMEIVTADTAIYIYSGQTLDTLTVDAVFPTQNEISASPYSEVRATFSADINPATLDSTTVKIRGKQSGPKTGSISYDAPSQTVTFVADESFLAGERIYVELTKGIQANSGASMPYGYAFSFRIATTSTDTIHFVRENEWTFQRYSNGLVCGDLNGDNQTDLFMQLRDPLGYRAMLLYPNGSVDIDGDIAIGVPVLADLDGDRDLDVVGIVGDTPTFLWNDGSGAFPDTTMIGTTWRYDIITPGDLDGDGDLDLVMTAPDINPTNEIHIFLNNGNRTFSFLSSLPGTRNMVRPILEDLNGDGIIDLVVTEGYHVQQGPRIRLGKGAGVFDPPTTYPASGSITNNGVEMDDLDGDGDLDLPIGQGNEGLLWILANDGAGQFTTGQTITGLPYPSGMRSADLDGNGAIDLLFHSYAFGRSLVIIKNSGTELSHYETISLPDLDFPQDLAIGDMDNDGDVDAFVYIISTNPSNRKLIYFKNTAAESQLRVNLPDTATAYNDSISVPVRVTDTTGKGIVSAELSIAYDTRIAMLAEPDRISTDSTLVALGWSIEDNVLPGSNGIDTLTIAMSTAQDTLSGEGVLIHLNFITTNIRHPDSTALQLVHVLFNDGAPSAESFDGQIKLVGVNGAVDSQPDSIYPRQSILVHVIDADENRNPAAIDTTWARIHDTVYNQIRYLFLPETGASTGEFTGIVHSNFDTMASLSDTLSVIAGDSIRVVYFDSLSAAGTTDERHAYTRVYGGASGQVKTSYVVQALDQNAPHSVIRDTIRIQIGDSDMDRDVGTPDQFTATITNFTRGEKETLLLSETGNHTGVFRSKMPTIEGTSGIDNDGVLSIASWDTVFAIYTDSLTQIGSIDTTMVMTRVVNLFGDVRPNDDVQAFDAARLLAISVALDSVAHNSQGKLVGDVDGDGEILAFDASLVLQYVVRLIDRFPVQTDTTNIPIDFKNHPFLKPVPLDRIITLGNPQPQSDGTYVQPIHLTEREGILSGTLTVGADQGIEMLGVTSAPEYSRFMTAHNTTSEGINIAFAGSRSDLTGSGDVLLLKLRAADGIPIRLSLDQVYLNGQSLTPTVNIEAIETVEAQVNPLVTQLYQNVPNPFNPQTTIRYDLATAGQVNIVIYSITGQRIRTLVSEYQEIGSYQLTWNSLDALGKRVASGIYFVRLTSTSFRQTRKMLLLQ